MFGYACRETAGLMPAPLYYAHEILRTMRDRRVAGDHSVLGLLPDAKSQVTLRYVDGKPVGATSVVVSTQHEEHLEQAEIKRMLWPLVETTLPQGGCRRSGSSTSTRRASSALAGRTAIAG
jgi:S-adenosylmethionine synthetase